MTVSQSGRKHGQAGRGRPRTPLPQLARELRAPMDGSSAEDRRASTEQAGHLPRRPSLNRRPGDRCLRWASVRQCPSYLHGHPVRPVPRDKGIWVIRPDGNRTSAADVVRISAPMAPSSITSSARRDVRATEQRRARAFGNVARAVSPPSPPQRRPRILFDLSREAGLERATPALEDAPLRTRRGSRAFRGVPRRAPSRQPPLESPSQP